MMIHWCQAGLPSFFRHTLHNQLCIRPMETRVSLRCDLAPQPGGNCLIRQ